MRKRKILLVFCLSVTIILLSNCRGSFVRTEETMNLNTFLELTEENEFSFIADKAKFDGLLNGQLHTVYIGSSRLNIYEYDSHEAMLIDSSLVGENGSSISSIADPSLDDSSFKITYFSWASPPHWFKRDLIIVLYVGTNNQIINFLHENFELFAGRGF